MKLLQDNLRRLPTFAARKRVLTHLLELETEAEAVRVDAELSGDDDDPRQVRVPGT